jgi:hypothetical protein
MKKGYLIALIFLVIAVSCATAYNIIGSSIDENGMLHEPFGLIPIGYFFLFLGIIWALVTVIRSFFRR